MARGISNLLLAALLVACLAGVSEASSRSLLGKYPYVQCGGSGDGCKGTKCKDAVWPGFQCAKGLKCYRISQYYRQCDVKQPPKDTEAPTYKPADFHQCGGKGNNCKGSKCKDAKWPANQGGMCAHGLVCVRVSQWYRGCDVPGKASG